MRVIPPKARASLRKIWVFMERNLWIRYFWVRWSLPFRIINIITAVAIWVFMVLTASWGMQPFLQPYGGDLISFLIIDLCVNTFFSYSLVGFYNIILGLYTSNLQDGGSRVTMMDYITLAMIPIHTYILGNIFDGYLEQAIDLGVYLIAGFGLFGLHFSPRANYGLAVTTFGLGLLSTIGLGLISASMIWLIGAKAGNEPFQWIISTLVGIVSGIYFPPEILPGWLRILGSYLPQTYALKVIRLALLAGYSFEYLAPDILLLLFTTIFLIPFGIIILALSIRMAKKIATI